MDGGGGGVHIIYMGGEGRFRWWEGWRKRYFLVPLRELFRDGSCKRCYLVGTHPLGII